MTLLNQYSYALAVVVALVWLGAWAYRRRTPLALALLAATAALAVGANLALRTDASEVSAAELERTLADGRPTLVLFHSNY